MTTLLCGAVQREKCRCAGTSLSGRDSPAVAIAVRSKNPRTGTLEDRPLRIPGTKRLPANDPSYSRGRTQRKAGETWFRLVAVGVTRVPESGACCLQTKGSWNGTISRGFIHPRLIAKHAHFLRAVMEVTAFWKRHPIGRCESESPHHCFHKATRSASVEALDAITES